MNKAKWIWYFGDFELYHHMLLSCRREETEHDYPCMWHISRPEICAHFFKECYVPKDTSIRVVTHSKGMVQIDDTENAVNIDLPLTKGKHLIVVKLCDVDAFPSVYINSEYVVTDETWVANPCFGQRIPVGFMDCYDSEEDDPKIFPFKYEDLIPISVEDIGGGRLYDFGKETFGPVMVKAENLKDIRLVYGESRKEALDNNNAVIRETLKENDDAIRPSRAFRYIFVKCPDGVSAEISAQYEYLPLEDKGSFECDDEEIKEIWDTCAYTFHLNSRECFLDGIKRDRWVWSGDAYQSFKISRLLYNDPSITERTIISMLGKPPYMQHINTINDYSAYLIIAVWEHYFHTGNKVFLEGVYSKIKELYNFIDSRLDESGYVVKRDDDWIFIDWGVLDKEGAHCAEQILLWQVYKSMKNIASVMGDKDEYSNKESALKEKIIRDYWNDEKGAFIDSFESGKNFVSRQTNTFAILFDFADKKQTESIIKNVFENGSLPQITTPYFKLYELMAFCKVGKLDKAQEYINSYWGQMLKLGATSVWEFFDPNQSDDEHLNMYGKSYGKSLCHAWGSGPILLLLQGCTGINITSAGAKTFEINPNPGRYNKFSATVPVGNGTVKVSLCNGKYTVYTDVSGGTFMLDGKRTELEPNVEYTF